jgi:putative membrane protein insertion efficiency factor
MRRSRGRRYDPYDDDLRYYDPYYSRRGYGWQRPQRDYYRQPAGGFCLRDACFLESGCCLGEALSGNFLVLAVLVLPQLVSATVRPPVPRRGLPRPVGRRLVAVIRVYQREISPRRPSCCRFSPTCSEYAAQALHAHGAARGTRLALRRLVRCRPGGRPGQDDPAPRAATG